MFSIAGRGSDATFSDVMKQSQFGDSKVKKHFLPYKFLLFLIFL